MDETTRGGEDAAKDLLRLLTRKGELTAEEASLIMGVERDVVDGWAKILGANGLLTILHEDTPNPTLKPRGGPQEEQPKKPVGVFRRGGEPISSATQVYPARPGRAAAGGVLSAPGLSDVEMELAEKKHILDGLTAELMAEKKAKAALEERLAALATAPEAGPAADLKERLERERGERAKLESALKARNDDVEALRAEAARLGGGNSKSILAEVGEKVAALKSKLWSQGFAASCPSEMRADFEWVVREEDEIQRLLSTVLGSETVYAAPPEEPQPAATAEPQAAAGEPQQVLAAYEPPAAEAATPAAEDEAPAAGAPPEEAPAPPRPPPEAPPARDSAELVKLLMKGTMKLKNLARALGADDATAQAWLRDLQGLGAIEVRKPMLGGMEVSLKTGVDPGEILGRINQRRLRADIRRAMGR
jgi:hypothetical protein